MVRSGSKSAKGGGEDERLGDIEDVMREKKWNGVFLAENLVIKKVFDLFLRGPWPLAREERGARHSARHVLEKIRIELHILLT